MRRVALSGLAQTCEDETDRKLLSRDIDALDPWLDPQQEIDEAHVAYAAERLEQPAEEVCRRYEALAERFGLKLAWRRPTAEPCKSRSRKKVE